MIEIKDKEYELKYTVNTLCIMAEDGIDVMNIADMNINIVTIRDLFYYGLKHENKRITKNQAGELMDELLEYGYSFKDLVELVMEALTKSLGKKKEDTEEQEEEEEVK